MTESLRRRGPDDSGEWQDPGNAIYLGHRRLSVIDIESGSQPMWLQDGSAGIVYNGEIYNHVELRRELESRGHRFFSDHSDTEVLLHGYREWGESLPEHLNGMWSYVIYDRDKRLLFASRDRFGKKPFYYTQNNNLFAFSSELDSLLQHSSITCEISDVAIKKYFAYGFIPSPHSVCKNINKLPAAHNLMFDLKMKTLKVYAYWDLMFEPVHYTKKHEAGLVEEMNHLVELSVKRRLLSDVPIGVFLSGGLDSSFIAAHAVKSNRKSAVDTFSVGFESAAFDESGYARRVGEFLGCRHHVQTLNLGDIHAAMPEVISRLDEPMGDSSLIPTYLLCKFARSKVTVALGGDGADEMLAGYAPFKALSMAQYYSKIVPASAHSAIKNLAALLPVSHGYMSFDFKLKRFLRGLSYPYKLWNPIWLGPLEPHELEECFADAVDTDELYEEAIAAWDSCSSSSIIDRTLRFYTKLYLPDNILTKIDRASMMNGLEVRSPFLDIDLVNFLRKVPHTFKFHAGQTKYLLRTASKGMVPDEIRQKPKQGFAMPIGAWFRSGELAVNAASEVNKQNSGFVENMVRQHREGRADHRLFLWNQWVLMNNSVMRH